MLYLSAMLRRIIEDKKLKLDRLTSSCERSRDIAPHGKIKVYHWLIEAFRRIMAPSQLSKSSCYCFPVSEAETIKLVPRG